MQRLLQGGQVEIIGLARQRVNDGEPLNSGYLLSPRDELDFKFAPLTRYRETAGVALVVLGCFLYLWWRRRAAEKREQALTILSEGWKESDERFRQMAGSVGEVFWMLDVERNQLLYVSPAFERIWGRDPTCLDERLNLMDTVHPEDRERALGFLERNTRQAAEETYRIIRPDGAVRWIHDRSFPIFNQAGKLYRVTGIAADITDRRELEEQLRQAQKMDAVGRLAGGVAHDFNNLLTVIGGYSQHLLDSTSPEDPKRTALEQILKASNRAAALTSQLLAFGRKQVLRPQLINLNHLLTNMESLLRRVMGEHITFHAVLSKTVLFVKADPNQLEQVLINLAANARDAMPDGGEFRIETALIDASEGGAEGRLKEGRYARLKVSDTGIGMNTKVLEHLFEPFFTTKAVGKGSGLGLSTVYGIVQQNHGTIHVTSERGRGTAFEIYLPAVPAGEEVKEPAAAVSGSLHGHETILLAEDEPAVRKLVRDALEQLGYTVLPAADGYEAMRILEVHSWRRAPVVDRCHHAVDERAGTGEARAIWSSPRPRWCTCPVTPTTPWPFTDSRSKTTVSSRSRLMRRFWRRRSARSCRKMTTAPTGICTVRLTVPDLPVSPAAAACYISSAPCPTPRILWTASTGRSCIG